MKPVFADLEKYIDQKMAKFNNPLFSLKTSNFKFKTTISVESA